MAAFTSAPVMMNMLESASSGGLIRWDAEEEVKAGSFGSGRFT
jgi:hypothetical protein